MEDTGQIRPEEQFGAAELDARITRLREETIKRREYIINRLWAGNGGGAVTCITILGVALKDGSKIIFFVKLTTVLFLAGLIALGFGAFLSFHRITRRLEAAEQATSILDLKVDQISRPSDDAGLRFHDSEIFSALLASATFMAGVFFGVMACTLR